MIRPPTLRVASYNMHKGVGLDRRFDPERILAVLREVRADVVALQECDARLGERASLLPHAALVAGGWEAVAVARRQHSLGWHGNALLVRAGTAVRHARALDLPALEPRGAVIADLEVDGRALRVVGMHLDLSGLWRRRQVRTLLAAVHADGAGGAAVMMGDMNQWSDRGCLSEFGPAHRLLATGPSFHALRPVAALDRIVVSGAVAVEGTGVHHSALARLASDHLPVWADLTL